MSNRLSREKSPYLLQHQNNPVDWHAWGPEAFEQARQQDKPVFLSVGYSTCHWCHVMAHESFEDAEVAAALNDSFICIKVDREERPDIDQIYMSVCQMMTGHGGWPLTVVMTPDQQPFFAGTYFPKHSRHGRIGVLDLCRRLSEVWQTDRARVTESAAGITALLREAEAPGGSERPELTLQDRAFEQLREHYDPEYGGFREAPKFPSPHQLLFLLRYGKRTGQTEALLMVEKTLTQMRRGGLFDQLGFGFHRYSTDERWLLPHFEKMLYDQALLLLAYSEAWQVTGHTLYRETAEMIVSYVLRDLRDAAGGFYCAEDADSEGEEGKFYVWTYSELQALTNPQELQLLQAHFGVTPQGNFYDEATQQLTGANILHLSGDLPDSALWEPLRERLFNTREQRVRPHRDDKILTDWNGLMIAALARSAFICNRPDWLEAAEHAADFVLTHLQTDSGLLHRYRDGESGIDAHLDDYAMLIWGLLELYQADSQPQRLQQALRLAEAAGTRFGAESGGYYFSAHDGETLIARKREFHDGSVPSGNNVMLHNLLRLHHLTGELNWREAADTLAAGFYTQATRFPLAYLHFVSGLEWLLGEPSEVVLALPPDTDATAWLNALRERFLPLLALHVHTQHSEQSAQLQALVPWLARQVPHQGQATAYVCQAFACAQPALSPEALSEQLTRI